MCTWPIPMYQAILLHIIFAFISKKPISLGLDLKPSLQPADSDLLAALVLSCRRLGMLQYANILARYNPDDLASYVWVGVEEVKRFNLALFQLCRRLSSEKQNTRVEGDAPPAPTSWLLTSHELEFPVPKNDALWNAKDRTEWMDATNNMQNIDLANFMESEWIAKSAEPLLLT